MCKRNWPRAIASGEENWEVGGQDRGEEARPQYIELGSALHTMRKVGIYSRGREDQVGPVSRTLITKRKHRWGGAQAKPALQEMLKENFEEGGGGGSNEIKNQVIWHLARGST